MKLTSIVTLASLAILPVPAICDSHPGFSGLGYFFALNYTYWDGLGIPRTAGCLNDDFEWTLTSNARKPRNSTDFSRCGLFNATRGKWIQPGAGHYQYVYKSRKGICGLGENQRVVCGRWEGQGLGPLNGTDDGKGSLGDEVRRDAKKVLNETWWWFGFGDTLEPSSGVWLRWKLWPLERYGGQEKFFTDGMPIKDSNSSVWNNLATEQPEPGVQLVWNDVGIRIYWEPFTGVLSALNPKEHGTVSYMPILLFNYQLPSPIGL
ncbi:hypothetical protein B0J11DRAFT_601624 [Dendryphion nanum]|uniref:Uncharacterized protein n=1 Tax=Dendryphion nanum TaxID=256645 RepID=A0A9P9CYV5_9PLEO|nr:hypothetical protein B0J11DRAFT_601624 [Dendryphion nanum]